MTCGGYEELWAPGPARAQRGPRAAPSEAHPGAHPGVAPPRTQKRGGSRIRPAIVCAYSVAPQGVTVPVVALTIGVDQTAAGPKSPSPEKVVWMVAISVGPR